ncbi:hypothetical protein [Cyclobacterium amurskyense]|uniref:Uncharacterized protein n=1 Tax=Cyclobacterium amurskyense TaxID=320787 RepID=A0A0H4PMR0_9BACT|nr:hypothetical protein [Cyclobacterium amurskyense]AKP49547.1 hypothetical protein CA2015_0062 [Cyclobacterium amurskyense]
MNSFSAIKWIALVIVVNLSIQNAIAQSKKASNASELKILEVVAISDKQLQVNVEYNYTGKAGSNDTFIHAFPVESDGESNFKEVDIEKVPLKSGINQVSLLITKRPKTKAFTSESIKVCMMESRNLILCGEYSFEKSWPNFDLPVKILSFSSSESKVSKGDSVTISWQTENASKVMFGVNGSEKFQQVRKSGSLTVGVDKTTTYILMVAPMAEKGGAVKMETKALTIDVPIDPVIGRFTANRNTIRRGQNSKLTWEVYEAEEISLNGESVIALGDKIVSPIKTMKYTLEARKGEVIISEDYVVMVTPFGAPDLSNPFSSIELCRSVDESGESYRCISSDGPFTSNDKIYAIVRIENLSKASHNLKLTTYNSFDGEKWIEVHQENRSLPKRDTDGYLEFKLEVQNTGEGKKKLEFILDGNNTTKSEIVYCIDCSRMWE